MKSLLANVVFMCRRGLLRHAPPAAAGTEATALTRERQEALEAAAEERIEPPAPSHAYRGVASGRPPSTGIVAPVVGVCRVAKKSTARATWSAVIRAFRRLRLR